MTSTRQTTEVYLKLATAQRRFPDQFFHLGGAPYFTTQVGHGKRDMRQEHRVLGAVYVATLDDNGTLVGFTDVAWRRVKEYDLPEGVEPV
mgnify:CR=1 FL=1